MLRFYQISMILSFITTALAQVRLRHLLEKHRDELVDEPFDTNYFNLTIGIFLPIWNTLYAITNLITILTINDEAFLVAMDELGKLKK